MCSTTNGLVVLGLLMAFTVLLVSAAPANNVKARSPKAATGLKATKSSSVSKPLKRSKREAYFEDIPVEGNQEDILRQELSQLSDGELKVLADIVQNEINNFPNDYAEEEEEPQQYEIVEIPDEQLLEAYRPRDRRSFVEQLEDEEEEEEQPEIIVVPEVLVEQALQEEQDDLELRQRIAQMADILNERSLRRFI